MNQMNINYKVAEVKLSYRGQQDASNRVKISDSKAIYQLLINNWEDGSIEHRECFKIVLMNRSNAVLGIFTASEGGISEIVVDIRMIMQAAILANASFIILTHNHPSGNLQPSWQDDDITRKIKAAANIHNITVLDHVIITSTAYYSYSDDGRLM